MGLQQVLILLGVVIFAGILLDALRRKRAAARRLQDDDYDDPEEAERRAQVARELPGLGEARNRKDLDPLFDEIDIFDDDPIPVLRNRLNTPAPATEAPRPAPVQEADADDERLPQAEEAAFANDPFLAEPLQDEEELAWEKMRRQFEVDPEFLAESRRSMVIQQQELQRLQERRAALVEEPLDEAAPVDEPMAVDTVAYAEPVYEEAQADEELQADEEPLSEEAPQPVVEPLTTSVEEARVPVEEDDEDPALTAEELEAYLRDDEDEEQQLRAALLTNLEKSTWGGSQEFLTIHVQAQESHPFAGRHLKKFMEMIGMRLSLTGFYHYVEEKDGQSVLGYSLVNMFAPGHFDAASLDDFSTLGVVLVMPLPNTQKSMVIFERMLATARVMEKNWGAELQDEQRSNLTQQTAEHYRQRIKDFEHKTRLQARKAGKA